MRRKKCLPQTGLIVPPTPIIALASARTVVVDTPVAPAFAVLFDPASNLYVLDPDSFGFTLLNGALVYQGPAGRRIDVRGHATLSSDQSTDARLGIVVDGTTMIGAGLDAEGRGFAGLLTGVDFFVAADALVILNPGQTLSLGVQTGGPVQITANDLSIVAQVVN